MYCESYSWWDLNPRSSPWKSDEFDHYSTGTFKIVEIWLRLYVTIKLRFIVFRYSTSAGRLPLACTPVHELQILRPVSLYYLSQVTAERVEKLEFSTSDLEGRRSNQLSYTRIMGGVRLTPLSLLFYRLSFYFKSQTPSVRKRTSYFLVNNPNLHRYFIVYFYTSNNDLNWNEPYKKVTWAPTRNRTRFPWLQVMCIACNALGAV
jgi:hypothetical protein